MATANGNQTITRHSCLDIPDKGAVLSSSLEHPTQSDFNFAPSTVVDFDLDTDQQLLLQTTSSFDGNEPTSSRDYAGVDSLKSARRPANDDPLYGAVNFGTDYSRKTLLDVNNSNSSSYKSAVDEINVHQTPVINSKAGDQKYNSSVCNEGNRMDTADGRTGACENHDAGFASVVSAHGKNPGTGARSSRRDLNRRSSTCSRTTSNTTNGARTNKAVHRETRIQCIHSAPVIAVDRSARRKLVIASTLCLSFMVGEIIGGTLAGSLAIISDAVHLLTDLAGFLISLSALQLAHRPPTNRLNFGWHRIEVLGALLSILLLWVLTGTLCYSAVLRIRSATYEIDAKIMLITAATGVFFNVVLATVLNEDLDASEETGTSENDSDNSPMGYRDLQNKVTSNANCRGRTGMLKNYESLPNDIDSLPNSGENFDAISGEEANEKTPLLKAVRHRQQGASVSNNYLTSGGEKLCTSRSRSGPRGFLRSSENLSSDEALSHGAGTGLKIVQTGAKESRHQNTCPRSSDENERQRSIVQARTEVKAKELSAEGVRALASDIELGQTSKLPTSGEEDKGLVGKDHVTGPSDIPGHQTWSPQERLRIGNGCGRIITAEISLTTKAKDSDFEKEEYVLVNVEGEQVISEPDVNVGNQNQVLCSDTNNGPDSPLENYINYDSAQGMGTVRNQEQIAAIPFIASSFVPQGPDLVTARQEPEQNRQRQRHAPVGSSRSTLSPRLGQKSTRDVGGISQQGEGRVWIQKRKNLNLQAAYIHVLGDLCQSIGVLLAAYIIYFKPEWKIADPICTFSFSFFVMVTTVPIVREIVIVLMEAVPRGFDVSGLKDVLLDVPGVTGVHDVRVWSITLDKIAISAHLWVEPENSPSQVLRAASQTVKDNYRPHELSLQLELEPQMRRTTTSL